jgi:hypothetical protein
MDSKFLPKDLQPDHQLEVSADDYPLSQTNPVTGYRTSLYRQGTNANFLGWIELVNGDQTTGYIYIMQPVRAPYLGSTRYVVMDITPDLLGSLLRILQSSEPLQIRFEQPAANSDAAAFLEHRL